MESGSASQRAMQPKAATAPSEKKKEKDSTGGQPASARKELKKQATKQTDSADKQKKQAGSYQRTTTTKAPAEIQTADQAEHSGEDEEQDAPIQITHQQLIRDQVERLKLSKQELEYQRRGLQFPKNNPNYVRKNKDVASSKARSTP